MCVCVCVVQWSSAYGRDFLRSNRETLTDGELEALDKHVNDIEKRLIRQVDSRDRAEYKVRMRRRVSTTAELRDAADTALDTALQGRLYDTGVDSMASIQETGGLGGLGGSGGWKSATLNDGDLNTSLLQSRPERVDSESFSI